MLQLSCDKPYISWMLGIEILPLFHNLVVTTSAVAMERLLVGQGHQFSSVKLDLRNFRQELRLGVHPRMTIATAIYFGGSRVFLEQVRR